eukprot:2875168-Prymnesium_polylepis.2
MGRIPRKVGHAANAAGGGGRGRLPQHFGPDNLWRRRKLFPRALPWGTGLLIRKATPKRDRGMVAECAKELIFFRPDPKHATAHASFGDRLITPAWQT